MSLLKTCLVCLVTAVASASPPVVPKPHHVSGRKPNFSNMFKSNDLMKNKMADLTTRVARMEQRDDQQKDALEKMTKDVYQITNNLQLTFKDVSRRMDILEKSLKSRPTPRPVSQGQTGSAKEEVTTFEKELDAEMQKDKLEAVDEARSNLKIDDGKDEITKGNNNDVPQETVNAIHVKDNKGVGGSKDNDENVEKKYEWGAYQTEEVEEKQYTEKEMAAMIEACGRPPMSEGLSAEVSMYGGKIMATYTCSKQYVLITPGDEDFATCTGGVWSPTKAYCSNLTTCGHSTFFRMEYNGTLNVTKSGKTCQRWSKQSPHEHYYNLDMKFGYTTGFEEGETVDQASNYCRDPGLAYNVHQVWCYTTDPDTRWEKCAVPECT